MASTVVVVVIVVKVIVVVNILRETETEKKPFPCSSQRPNWQISCTKGHFTLLANAMGYPLIGKIDRFPFPFIDF